MSGGKTLGKKIWAKKSCAYAQIMIKISFETEIDAFLVLFTMILTKSAYIPRQLCQESHSETIIRRPDCVDILP
jgi:hypothetical protein